MLSLAMSLLYFRWVRDSQSGMWVFRRSILEHMHLESDGMAFSEEIKIEALKNSPNPVRGNLDPVYVAAGRDQAESLAGRLLQSVFSGEEAVLRSEMADPGRVSCIPTWNRALLLGAEALGEPGAPDRHPIDRVIVVDNGSTDDSARGARRARERR